MGKVAAFKNLKSVQKEDLLKASIYKVINFDGEHTVNDWAVSGDTVITENKITPLDGDTSIKYTQVATSIVGNKATLVSFNVPLQAQNKKKHTLVAHYSFINGSEGDFAINILGASSVIRKQVKLKSGIRYIEAVFNFLPGDTQLQLQLEVLSVTSGASVELGSVEFSDEVEELEDNILPTTNYMANMCAADWTLYRNSVDGLEPDDFGGTPSNIPVVTDETLAPLRGQSSIKIDKTTSTSFYGHGYYLDIEPEIADLNAVITIVGDLLLTGIVNDDLEFFYLVSTDDFATFGLPLPMLPSDLLANESPLTPREIELPLTGKIRICIHCKVTTTTLWSMVFNWGLGNLGHRQKLCAHANGTTGHLVPSVTNTDLIYTNLYCSSLDNSMNITTGVFTSPRDGQIQFEARVALNDIMGFDGATDYLEIFLSSSINGLMSMNKRIPFKNESIAGIRGSMLLSALKGEEFKIVVHQSSGTDFSVTTASFEISSER